MTKEERKEIWEFVPMGLEILSIFSFVIIWELWNEEYKAASLMFTGFGMLLALYVSLIVVCCSYNRREKRERQMKEAEQRKEEQQRVS